MTGGHGTAVYTNGLTRYTSTCTWREDVGFQTAVGRGPSGGEVRYSSRVIVFGNTLPEVRLVAEVVVQRGAHAYPILVGRGRYDGLQAISAAVSHREYHEGVRVIVHELVDQLGLIGV